MFIKSLLLMFPCLQVCRVCVSWTGGARQLRGPGPGQPGPVCAQDGPGQVRGDAEQQPEGPADGHLPLESDQDPAPTQREALHGLRKQYQGNGKDSAPRVEVSPRHLKQTRILDSESTKK